MVFQKPRGSAVDYLDEVCLANKLLHLAGWLENMSDTGPRGWIGHPWIRVQCVTMCVYVQIAWRAKVISVMCTPYRWAPPCRVIQVQVPPNDVELDSEQNHQHAGAVHSHYGPCKTWMKQFVREKGSSINKNSFLFNQTSDIWDWRNAFTTYIWKIQNFFYF